MSSANSRAPCKPIFYKTKMCKFFQMGKCTRLGNCAFAHNDEELLPLPDFSRTKMCPKVTARGWCGLGTACKFAHRTSELRVQSRPQGRGCPADMSPMSDGSQPAFFPVESSGELESGPRLPLECEATELSDSDDSADCVDHRSSSRSTAVTHLPSDRSLAESTGSSTDTSWVDEEEEDWEECSERSEQQESSSSPFTRWHRYRNLTAQQIFTPQVAQCLKLQYTVKNTFMTFADSEEPLCGALRRSRSVGSLPHQC